MLMPLDEWAQPVILALQSGAPLLAEHGTRGFFRDPRFRRGFAELARRGLTFDAWCYHPQIPEVADLARAFPDTTIVLPGHGVDTTIGAERPHLDEWIERGW